MMLHSERHSFTNGAGRGLKMDDIANSSFFSAQDLMDFPSPRPRGNSHASFSTAVTFHDSEKVSFSGNVKKHYKMIVKLLPILIIFVPSVLKMFFPDVIRFGEFQIGDQKTHPSIIVIDTFSILLICWVLKFLLDWPWKWYSQIRAVKRKLISVIDQHGYSKRSEENPVLKDTMENLRFLKVHKLVALLLCFTAPFICGWILLFSRDYILTYEQGFGENGEKSLIFSDLNIGIFICCGLIRLIIQLSEHVQLATASLEAEAEKVVSEQAVSEETHLSDAPFFEHVQELNERIIGLEKKVDNISSRFEVFYQKNKFSIENDLGFLSTKHFKILEKEINETNKKINATTDEVESRLMLIQCTPIEQSQAEIHQISEKKSSLHGIPLPSKEPSYLTPNRSSPSYPVDVCSMQASNPLKKLKINTIWNFFPSLSINSSEILWQNDLDDAVAHHIQELDGDTIFDMSGSRPIFGYVFNVPFVLQRVFWRAVSFIPLRVLKAVYIILLLVLDALIDLYHNKIEHVKKEDRSTENTGISQLRLEN